MSEHLNRTSFCAVFAAACLAMMAATGARAQAVAKVPLSPGNLRKAISASLADRVRGTIDQSGLKALVCVYVRETTGSKTLVDLNGETPVAPASNNKLLTTAASLTLLGADYQSTTSLFRTGPLENGVLKGNLVVQGCGDPVISPRFEKDKSDTTIILKRWAKKLHERGLNEIDGDIVADDSFFDDVYFHPKWYPSERGEWYEAEVSALSLNDACVDLHFSGKDKMPGDLAGLTVSPDTAYVHLDNEVRIAAKGRPTERYYKRAADSNDILATGTLTVESAHTDYATVHDPALFFVTVFREVLEKEGIRVKGSPVKRRGAADGLPASDLLLVHQSPRLSDIVKVINLVSHNLYAETLCKTLGRVIEGRGSFEAGTQVVAEFCRINHIFHDGYHPVDGSGLSAENRVTPHQLVDVLNFMDHSENRTVWRESLPRGGKRGSLLRRFQDTAAHRAIAPRIMGKTGLIGGVRSLTGIITRPDGTELYYSIILNRLRGRDGDKGIALIDQIAYTIAR